MKEEGFYAILPSNSCSDTQPNNQANKFTISWENAINLYGNWKVALVEFNCRFSPLTVTSDNYFVIKRYKEPIEEVTIVISHDNGKLSWMSTNTIINNHFRIRTDQSNHLMIERRDNIFFSIKIKANDAVSMGFLRSNIEYSSEEGKSTIRSPNPINSQNWKRKLTIKKYDLFITNFPIESNRMFRKMSNLCNFMMIKYNKIFNTFELNNDNIIELTLKFQENDKWVEISFAEQFGSIFGLEMQTYRVYDKNEKIQAIKQADLLGMSKNIYIYSNIVDCINVGGISAPLLRSIYISRDSTDDSLLQVFSKEVKHLMFLPVSTNYLNNIEIVIRGDNGNLFNFSEGSKTSITLYFRKCL